MDNGQTVRMSVGTKEILITFRVSFGLSNSLTPYFTCERAVQRFDASCLICAGSEEPGVQT